MLTASAQFIVLDPAPLHGYPRVAVFMHDGHAIVGPLEWLFDDRDSEPREAQP
jgi:hypothetical protein